MYVGAARGDGSAPRDARPGLRLNSVAPFHGVPMFRRSHRLLVSLFLLALVGPHAGAQSLRGPLSDATTGPVTPGVHSVTGSISVASGATLTVQAGAILKFNA